MGLQLVVVVLVVAGCATSTPFAVHDRPREYYERDLHPTATTPTSHPDGHSAVWEGVKTVERKEKEEEALSLAAAVSSGRRDETSGLWEGDRKESRQRRSNMCYGEEEELMILDFVTALTDQLDQGVPIETVRDFLQLNFGSQWEQELIDRNKRSPFSAVFKVVTNFVTRVATRVGPRVAPGVVGGAGNVLLNGGTTVARTGVRGILKSMSSKFPSLMVQGGTMWAIAEGIDAIADSGNDKDEKEGNTSGSLTADLNQIETIVNDVVVNMTTIIAVVLRQHDQERVQSARALEGERLKQLEERRWSEMRRAEEREREDRERNLTAASIAGYLLEINDRQKASSLLLEKTERLLSENPLMFPERSGMWKRSSGEQWGEVSRDLTLGQKEISSALLKLSEVARNGLGDSETVGAAGEAAALIGGFGEIKARFNRLLKNKVAGHCAEYAEREKQVIVVTSIIGVSIGTVLAYASSAVAFCVFQRKLDRKLASR